jgi:hypothetical protein
MKQHDIKIDYEALIVNDGLIIVTGFIGLIFINEPFIQYLCLGLIGIWSFHLGFDITDERRSKHESAT